MGHINGLYLLAFVLIVAAITAVVIARSPKAPQQETDPQRDPITYHTTYRQRALMVAFVCNVMGYGTNSQHFARLRGSVLSEFAAYARLFDALENARRIMHIPAGEMPPEARDYFMANLPDDRGFALNCARYADFIEKLVNDAYVITTPTGESIPENLIIELSVVDAYRALRDDMWPSEDFNRQG